VSSDFVNVIFPRFMNRSSQKQKYLPPESIADFGGCYYLCNTTFLETNVMTDRELYKYKVIYSHYIFKFGVKYIQRGLSIDLVFSLVR
jgi:hypothetical protein